MDPHEDLNVGGPDLWVIAFASKPVKAMGLVLVRERRTSEAS